MAYYLFAELFKRDGEPPPALAIDEAHRIAGVVRNCLSYEITDYHLSRCVDLLKQIGAEEAEQVEKFRKTMIYFIKRRPAHKPSILDDEEVEELMFIIGEIDPNELKKKIREGVRRSDIDVNTQREELRKLEMVVNDLYRYFRSFEYSLPGVNSKGKPRGPLNYTYSYYKEEKSENERVQYRLFVKCYYVAPLIRKLLSSQTVAFSATIGDADIFSYETGIKAPKFSLTSDFPWENTRLFMPTDTPNLAVNARGKQDLTRAIRRIAKACVKLAEKKIRSLVVTVSNTERDKFMFIAGEEGLDAVSYGNGVTAKQVAIEFKDGRGDTLVGTVANYGEGVDLPQQIAPVIFFLRPGYPNPTDPGTLFEERRFGGMRWALWNWRVMVELLQVRGRNVRSAEDLGVTFFISQQFRRSVFPALPKWLEKSYVGTKTLDECLEEAVRLLE